MFTPFMSIDRHSENPKSKNHLYESKLTERKLVFGQIPGCLDYLHDISLTPSIFLIRMRIKTIAVGSFWEKCIQDYSINFRMQ